jgi:hypothetical protein
MRILLQQLQSIPAAETENSRLSTAAGRCQRWQAKAAGLRAAEEVN